MKALTEVPKMTHPLAKHWDQPRLEDVTIDETHAIMSDRTFRGLASYNTSNPSGVYEGKMWKRRVWDSALEQWTDDYDLCFFSESERPGYCTTNLRRILIV